MPLRFATILPMDQQTLLMDIGNVLLRVDLARMETTLAAHGVRPAKQEMDLLLEAAEAHERGLLGSASFLDRAASLLHLGESGRAFARKAWNDIFLPDAPIAASWEACRAMKERGMRVVLFSNTNETHIVFMKERWPELFTLADEAVYSCDIGALKPEDAFYEHAIRRLNLCPETTIYLDDKPENVEGGLRHGFRAHVFNWRDAEAELRRFLPS